ncbi:hypothetical protein [Clostridium intestinale]|uniref:Uncharacterized protein n=1 Tax=Clostridium intestinale URNW TaxID=1294142 RepID=U2PTB5_9CLOT|nr:hypothetical protein [Clostridium intestinale]ERK29690.1 hypothetical protein CINTURNW_2819 [Clostridium intestinale URNW]
MSIKEKALDLFDSAKEPAFDMACEVFLDGVVGIVAPGIVTTYMSYKQKRQEKIEYLVNGLINIAAIPDIKEDFILTYYDTLKETRIRDIAVLKFYEDVYIRIENKKTWTDICEELNISYEEYDSIREKLNRLGLLTTKKDIKIDNLYENILNIQEFLEKSYKGKTSKLKSFKKIDKRDSFQISKFGKEFIKIFNDIE